MGIRLDWQVEDEHVASNGLGESPQDVWQRRANRGRALLSTMIVAGLVFAIVGGIMARLWYVDFEIKRQLSDTVAAEAAALRIGDVAAYLYVQRSESDAWMLSQTDRFWQYQQLKQDHTVSLTGNVLDMTIDESRGRALVEEIIDGVQYQQVWFFWRYEDGWRHVPRDITFWGDQLTVEGEGFTVEYAELDAPLADALLPGLTSLWEEGCRWLACAAPPPVIMIRVVPDPAVGVSWSPETPDLLRIASPLTDRARVGVPLEPDTAHEIGRLLAARLVDHARGGIAPLPGSDSSFLLSALQDWLVGRFMGDGGTLGSSFIESLAQNYGEGMIGQLTHAVQPESSIALLSVLTGQPLEDVAVDWREFFQWRLALEPFLLAQGDSNGVLGLYDDLAAPEAQALIADPAGATRPVPTVLRVVAGAGSDGLPRAWAVVQYADGSEGPITFRLVDGVWRRSAADPAYSTYTG